MRRREDGGVAKQTLQWVGESPRQGQEPLSVQMRYLNK